MSERKPLISVVIPTYNSGAYVLDALVSALEQTYPHVEVIVVDDGSTDNTRQLLEPYRDRIAYVYQSNRGLSGARNAGISHASGDWIAFLDADDVWLPDKLQRQVDRLRDLPEAGLVHTDAAYLLGRTGRLQARPTPTPPFEGDCHLQLFGGNRIVVSSVIVRREWLERCGVFDESLRQAEDYDCWMRLAPHIAFAFVPETLVLYRLHDSNMSKDRRTLRSFEARVLDKALCNDSLAVRLGSRTIQSRYANLWFEVGYVGFDHGEFKEAHRAFARSLRYDWRRVHVWTLWGATMLPGSVVRGLRRAKQRAIEILTPRIPPIRTAH
jgi:glycosyltransferase involved in cell wall biosynthesis